MTKILLVEDDKSLREIYGVRLLAEGYDIVSAGDGEEALAMAIKERPQLIVSDVMMPKISGFDMLDILRSTTETKNIKVIMMTALSSEDQRARGEQLGADRYLVKSQVGIEDVVRTVHEVLGDMPTTSQNSNNMFSNPTPRPTNQNPQNTQQPNQAQPGSYQQPGATVSSLPQPTAPFSSPRPASLGDRIIHPISQDTPRQPDVSELMEKELSSTPEPATAPQSAPAPSQAPSPDPTPDTSRSAPAITIPDLPPPPSLPVPTIERPTNPQPSPVKTEEPATEAPVQSIPSNPTYDASTSAVPHGAVDYHPEEQANQSPNPSQTQDANADETLPPPPQAFGR